MNTWRSWGEGNGERGQSGKRGREQEKREESEEGASSPLYSESGIPDCCQITVRQRLEEMLTHNIYTQRADPRRPWVCLKPKFDHSGNRYVFTENFHYRINRV